MERNQVYCICICPRCENSLNKVQFLSQYDQLFCMFAYLVQYHIHFVFKIINELVADPRVARDKFVFDSVIILYY